MCIEERIELAAQGLNLSKHGTLENVKETESHILSAICDYLKARRYFFRRQNTAPAVQKLVAGLAFRRMPKHANERVPDLILIKKETGQFVGLGDEDH